MVTLRHREPQTRISEQLCPRSWVARKFEGADICAEEHWLILGYTFVFLISNQNKSDGESLATINFLVIRLWTLVKASKCENGFLWDDCRY
jgi:hypothetical protein